MFKDKVFRMDYQELVGFFQTFAEDDPMLKECGLFFPTSVLGELESEKRDDTPSDVVRSLPSNDGAAS